MGGFFLNYRSLFIIAPFFLDFIQELSDNSLGKKGGVNEGKLLRCL